MKKASLLLALILILTLTLSSCKNTNNKKTTSSEEITSSIQQSGINTNEISSISEDEEKYGPVEERTLTENMLKNFSCCKFDDYIIQSIEKYINESKDLNSDVHKFNKGFAIRKHSIPVQLVSNLSTEKVKSFEEFSQYLFKDTAIYSISTKDDVILYTLEIPRAGFYVTDGKSYKENFEIDRINIIKKRFETKLNLIEKTRFNFLQEQLGEKIVDLEFFLIPSANGGESIYTTTGDEYALVKTENNSYIISLEFDSWYFWRCRKPVYNVSGIDDGYQMEIDLPSLFDAMRYYKNPEEWCKFYDEKLTSPVFSTQQAEDYIVNKKYIYTIPEFIKHCKEYNISKITPQIQESMDNYGIPKP